MCLMGRSSYADSYLVNTSVLNLRTCASINCRIKGKLLAGDTVQVEEQYDSWSKVSTKYGAGYVVSRSIKIKNGKYVENTYLFLFLSVLVLLSIIFFIYKIIKYKQELKKNKELIQTVTSLDRGEPAELDLILKLLKSGFSPNFLFHDLYVTKKNGNFSQIDLVMLTDVGLIVFEVKDYNGWIYGRGNESKWTKVLAYGRSKYRFYNPIIQNQNHIDELKKIIEEDIPFYSVIVFYGNCKLKDVSFIPKRTFVTKGYSVLYALDSIFSEAKKIEYTDKDRIIKLLSDAVNKGNDFNVSRQHIDNIRDMLGTDRIFQ